MTVAGGVFSSDHGQKQKDLLWALIALAFLVFWGVFNRLDR